MSSTPSIISSVCIELESEHEYGLNISWNLVPCHLHDGADMYGYRIRYSLVSNRTSSHSMVTISTTERHDGVDCHAERRDSFTCLLSAQPLSIVDREQYQFQVAAANRFGTGPFSEPINVSPSSLPPGSYFARFPAQANISVAMLTAPNYRKASMC